MDIKETKEAVSVAVALTMAIDKSQEDGFQWTDFFSLVPALTKLPQAIEGANLIPAEIEDMDLAEEAELEEVMDGLDLKSDYTEKIAKQSVNVMAEVGKLLMLVREARKPE